jgi:hypothetical protein
MGFIYLSQISSPFYSGRSRKGIDMLEDIIINLMQAANSELIICLKQIKI